MAAAPINRWGRDIISLDNITIPMREVQVDDLWGGLLREQGKERSRFFGMRVVKVIRNSEQRYTYVHFEQSAGLGFADEGKVVVLRPRFVDPALPEYPVGTYITNARSENGRIGRIYAIAEWVEDEGVQPGNVYMCETDEGDRFGVPVEYAQVVWQS